MKAIIPFKFFIQWENHAIPQSQEWELQGSCSILWKAQELLPLEQADTLSRHGREVLQEPRRASLHFKPLTLPRPHKWIWPQVQISSKVRAAAPSPCAFKELGAAAPVEDPPSCKLQPGSHTTAAFQQISRPNGGKESYLQQAAFFS